MCTVYDRIFGHFPAQNPIYIYIYIYTVYIWLWPSLLIRSHDAKALSKNTADLTCSSYKTVALAEVYSQNKTCIVF